MIAFSWHPPDSAGRIRSGIPRDATGYWLVRWLAVMALLWAALSASVAPAQAQGTNLIQNGTFSQAFVGGSNTAGAAIASEFGNTNNGYTPLQTLAGWTTAGYNFVFLPNTADTTGATGQYNSVATAASPGFRLWGPNDGSNNTPAGSLPVSVAPSGGNFIGADGAYEVSAISQTVNGLTAGMNYTLSFVWAGAQQYNFSSATTEQWQVSLGGTTGFTKVVAPGGQGFSGWMNQTFTFAATTSSEVLSFLAIGTPGGQPPIALLANVSMTQVPEPAGIGLFLTGVACLLPIARARRTKAIVSGRTMAGFNGVSGATRRAGA